MSNKILDGWITVGAGMVSAYLCFEFWPRTIGFGWLSLVLAIKFGIDWSKKNI